jgi:hypothetical protein
MTEETAADLIFEGAVGLYREVRLEAWGDISNLVSFDSDLKSLGFTLVGDLLCSAVAHGVLRVYVNGTQSIRVLLAVGVKNSVLNVAGVFFDSRFADGGVVTTTTSPAVTNRPADGIHRKVCSWHGIYDLYGQHEVHLSEVKPLHGPAEPMGNTLLSVAQFIDSFSVRMSR